MGGNFIDMIVWVHRADICQRAYCCHMLDKVGSHCLKTISQVSPKIEDTCKFQSEQCCSVIGDTHISPKESFGSLKPNVVEGSDQPMQIHSLILA